MKNSRLIQQDNLLKSVMEVSNILKQRRPDLDITILQLAEVQTVLSKNNLSSDDLKWIDKEIRCLCHPKYLYDFCPLKLLEDEEDDKRLQRWKQILDRMSNQANLLCSSIKMMK